jgi:hypothetical protein
VAEHVSCEANYVHGQRCEGGGEEGTEVEQEGGHQKREEQGCQQGHRDEVEFSKVILGAGQEVRLVRINLAYVS